MSYFETITHVTAFKARRTAVANSRDINKWKEIPPGDKWSTAELDAARLIVRKITEPSHMLPALRNHANKAKEVRSQKQIQELVKGPHRPWKILTRTELVHLYGDGPGYLWVLLSRFRPHHGNNNVAPVTRPNLGFHPELATFEIAALFLWHVAWSCPPQNDTRHSKPECLVQFQSLPRQLAADTGAGAQIRTTADAELTLHVLDENENYKREKTHCPALVAAKKQFHDVKDGLPVLTDSLLGQLTCEALALRLSLARAGSHKGDKNVFMIVAARQYMRFLQFKISDKYVAELVADDGEKDMTAFVELWATPWCNLKNEAGRRDAIDNIVALILRQPRII